jgi:aspartate kinase
VKVMKFGGVALKDAAAMARVAQIVAAEREPRIVVASAMQGVTDQIQDALGPITKDEAQAHVLMSELRRIHQACADAIQSSEIRQSTRYLVDKSLDALERLLFGITYTEELTPRSHDLALSFGERLSVRLLAGHLQEAGVAAEPVDADKAGLITNGPYGWASPDLKATQANLGARIVPKTATGVPVVTGFFGADNEGHTTLFGRGGSDFSAAIIANATDAAVLEVWKESRGFMTADPRVVKKAVRVPDMSYEEAAELAAFGAKILHPRTVEPVALKHIPIHVREINDPQSAGTLIQDYEAAPTCFIRCVAARRGLSVIKLLGPGMGYTPGVAANVFSVLRQEGLNVINMAASEASFALLVDAKEARRAFKALQTLRGGVVQDVVAEDRMSLVAVVGKGLGDRVGSASRILGAVSEAGINLHMISLGASSIALNFAVREQDGEDALRAIHKTFIEGAETK